MSARELREWEAFYQLEPWGDEWRATTKICAEIHNAQRTEGPPLGPDDFFKFADPQALVAAHQADGDDWDDEPEDWESDDADDSDEDEQTPEQMTLLFARAGIPIQYGQS